MEPIIQSLWIGEELSKIEILSIKSFMDNCHIYNLYTYDNVKNIPPGVIVKDGNEILDKSQIFRYKNGSISAFSNLFRFVLLYKKGGYWVDTDMICVRKLPFKENDIVFTSEPSSNYQNKIPTSSLIKIPKKNIIALQGIKILQLYKKLILNGRMNWGAGPSTVKILIKNFKLEKNVLEWNQTCSCYCGDYQSIFDPIENGENKNIIMRIEDIPINMFCIHLWHQMIRSNNIDKNKTFKENSLIEYFKKKHL